MMKYNDDVTIMVCGKLNPTSIENIDNYLKTGKVVVSCWKDDDPDLLKSVKEKEGVKVIAADPIHEDVEKLHQEHPEFREFCRSFYYQARSIKNGLEYTETNHTIKTRSDEKFSDLSAMIRKYRESRGKYISSNIFWKKCDHGHFHIGDHLFMAPTIPLKNSYHNINWGLGNQISPLQFLSAKQEVTYNSAAWLGAPGVNPEFVHGCVEIVTAIHFLYAIGITINQILDRKESRKILLENFDVVNVNELGDYVVVNQGQGNRWENNFPIIDQEIINSKMEEIFFYSNSETRMSAIKKSIENSLEFHNNSVERFNMVLMDIEECQNEKQNN